MISLDFICYKHLLIWFCINYLLYPAVFSKHMLVPQHNALQHTVKVHRTYQTKSLPFPYQHTSGQGVMYHNTMLGYRPTGLSKSTHPPAREGAQHPHQKPKNRRHTEDLCASDLRSKYPESRSTRNTFPGCSTLRAKDFL